MSEVPIEILPFEGEVTVSLTSFDGIEVSTPASNFESIQTTFYPVPYEGLGILVSPRDITLAETNRSAVWGP